MKLPSGLFRKKAVRITGLVVLVFVSVWVGSKIGGPKGEVHQEVQATEEHAQDTIWTCSMHPQIRMTKPGKCPICFMDLIPLKQGGNGNNGSTDATRLSMSENAKIIAGILVAPAVRRNTNAEVRMTGKVALDETRVEMITARFPGRIDRLYVDYTGVPVKTGDHLAEIYSPELVSLQRELLEAARAVKNAGSDVSEMIRSSADRMFAAAKDKLRLLGFSERELEQILERGTTSDHMTIRAGQNGVVLRKLVEEGSYVQTGVPLFHIGNLTKLWVLLDAYESDVGWIRLGQKAEFTVEAFPGSNFAGSVSFIDPVVDPQTRTVKVRIVVGNSDGRLKPDMFVTANIKASLSKSGEVKNISLRGKWICPMHPQIVKDHAGTCDICGMPLVKAEELGYVTSGFEDVNPLVIPATAPLFTGERSLVYVEVPDAGGPTYEAREVVLGPRVEGYYIVKAGLTEGEKVVVKGAFKIDGELQIQAKPSMMNHQGGIAATGHAGHDMSSMSGKSTAATITKVAPPISNKPVSKEFETALHGLVAQYMVVTDALSKDNLDDAKAGLMELKKLAASITAPRGEQYRAWNEAQKALAEALTHAHHIAELADARSIFNNVSKQIIILEKQYLKNDGHTHYLAFCPMAFNSNGAYWVQEGETIKNPYLGEKMLKCGEIREKL
ncbi:MAG: efflux RND transporter periplasmic adaptor subunit [Chitinispirillaceae bacterium]|nr:efflux RND transporter periplasmic adaptor subunit [Chitinispirillaceae bacterium]